METRGQTHHSQINSKSRRSESENAPLILINDALPLKKVVQGDERSSVCHQWKRYASCILITLLVSVTAIQFCGRGLNDETTVVSIEDAQEHFIDIGKGKTIWFRTWGTWDGVPVLFVHGGPGQAVVDYHNGNKRFFDASKMFVIEVDQRGTGYSQPSVREDYRNMELYKDISTDVIARDYELVREYLGIEAWAIWGGSYGSTIGLNYCMLFPMRCSALLLRGIYLDTKNELKEVYTQCAFAGDERRTAAFERLYRVAQMDVERAGEETLDANDDRRLLQVYERMISRGDKEAIWTWHTFENNLMEDDPEHILDPDVIIEERFPEAQSVAFFETRLWLHGTFEKPSMMLQRVPKLEGIPVWICQGWHDKVCPPENALHLVDALEDIESPLAANFLDANHEDTDPVMQLCLEEIIDGFLKRLSTQS